MSKISCQKDKIRIPEEFEGIQVNCCKNPKCDNFGVPTTFNIKDNKYSDKDQVKSRDPNYVITGLAKDIPGIRCKACNSITPIKSNSGIFEEKERFSAYLKPKELSCPNPSCENHSNYVSESPGSYHKKGYTSGNQRYQCKLCKKTFSSGNKRRKQNIPEINKTFYKLLVNRVPVNRCCEILGINPQVYYHRVDWLYEQVLGFIQNREIKLINNFKKDRLYLCTDIQTHVCNWTQREDKRNTELSALGTADNISGYVFCWHFNFDQHASHDVIENETVLIDDYNKPSPHRKHARLWLKKDFEKSMLLKAKLQNSGTLIQDIELKYANEISRGNLEANEIIDNTVKPPAKGMLVHSDYTMYGHFYFLKDLFKNIEKVRFYLDQESGIKNAFMMSFNDRIIHHTADAFFVKTSKNLTNDEKERLVNEARKHISQLAGCSYSSLSIQERNAIIEELVVNKMNSLRKFPGGKELWLEYPFATKSEPEKVIAALTDISSLSEKHQARLYMKGSLHGIDRFFMQARRRVHYFERPFSIGTNARRTWYGYSAYNPAMYIKLAEIFRVFYNYIHIGEVDNKTPAMRLGLAKGPVSYEKIIYFD